jgi:hypothetical protein
MTKDSTQGVLCGVVVSIFLVALGLFARRYPSLSVLLLHHSNKVRSLSLLQTAYGRWNLGQWAIWSLSGSVCFSFDESALAHYVVRREYHRAEVTGRVMYSTKKSLMTVEGFSQARDDEISTHNSIMDDGDDRMLNADDDNHCGRGVVSSG